MARKTVSLKLYTTVRDEAVADGSITPGHLLQRQSTGKVKVHSVAGGNAQTLFAIEDDLQGNDISDVYADADRVQFNNFRSGDQVNAILKDGETIVIGDFLESAGNGELQKHAADTSSSAAVTTINSNQIVGVALEALDLSDSSGADPASSRLAVETV